MIRFSSINCSSCVRKRSVLRTQIQAAVVIREKIFTVRLCSLINKMQKNIWNWLPPPKKAPFFFFLEIQYWYRKNCHLIIRMLQVHAVNAKCKIVILGESLIWLAELDFCITSLFPAKSCCTWIHSAFHSLCSGRGRGLARMRWRICTEIITGLRLCLTALRLLSGMIASYGSSQYREMYSLTECVMEVHQF